MNQQGREFAKLFAQQVKILGQSSGRPGGSGGGGGFGGPSGIGKALGGAGGLMLLGGAALTLNSALFNGMLLTLVSVHGCGFWFLFGLKS